MAMKCRHRWGGAWLVIPALVCCLWAQAQEDPTALLSSNEPGVRNQAVRDLLAERASLVAQLTTMVDEQEDWEERAEQAKAAAYLLGEMRAVEAVPALVQFINLERAGLGPMLPAPLAPVSSADLWTLPAVRALVKIGEPCLDAVMSRLRGDGPGPTQPWVGPYCLRVLVELRGVQGTAEMLVPAITAEPDTDRRKLLLMSLQYLLAQADEFAAVLESLDREFNPYAPIP